MERQSLVDSHGMVLNVNRLFTVKRMTEINKKKKRRKDVGNKK